MLESHDVSEVLLVVLGHAYDGVKYSPHPFSDTVVVAIADDADGICTPWHSVTLQLGHYGQRRMERSYAQSNWWSQLF